MVGVYRPLLITPMKKIRPVCVQFGCVIKWSESLYVWPGVAVYALWGLGVFQRTRSKAIHRIIFPSPRTDTVDTMELECGVKITSMAKDVPRLKIVNEQIDFFYIGVINKGLDPFVYNLGVL